MIAFFTCAQLCSRAQVNIITTIAGNGTGGYGGDGGAATAAELQHPIGVAIDGSGNIYIGDHVNNVVRKISLDGTISTIAGNGTITTATNFTIALAIFADVIEGIWFLLFADC